MLRYQTVVLITIVASCMTARANYEDGTQVIANYTRAIEDYVTFMQKAENETDVVEAINNYSHDVKKIIPELQKVVRQYPELINERELPIEIGKKFDMLMKSYEKMGMVFKKIEQHMVDPDVRKAMQDQISITEGLVK